MRETRCPRCAASRRSRDLVRVLLREYSGIIQAGGGDPLPLTGCLDDLLGLHVYELQAQGPLHALLARLPRYCCSEYFPDVPSGGRNASGVLCEDVRRLTFPDACFDVVITQDVMEHVADAWKGFAEIHRVLRPGGKHIFTVPLHQGHATRQRARQDDRGVVEHLLPEVRHKDPLNRDGALVYWDFGDDLPLLLAEMRIHARVACEGLFYPPEAICNVQGENAYKAYREAIAANNHAGFFHYNSVVVVAERL